MKVGSLGAAGAKSREASQAGSDHRDVEAEMKRAMAPEGSEIVSVVRRVNRSPCQ